MDSETMTKQSRAPLRHGRVIVLLLQKQFRLRLAHRVVWRKKSWPSFLWEPRPAATMQACWYMILFPSKGFLLLCMHVLRRRAGRVASHRMALPARPVVLIPSLAFKKLACSKESFSSRGAVKDRANRWRGCGEKRNDGDSYRTVHLVIYLHFLLLLLF